MSSTASRYTSRDHPTSSIRGPPSPSPPPPASSGERDVRLPPPAVAGGSPGQATGGKRKNGRDSTHVSPRRESPQPLRETVRRVSSYGSNGPLSYPAGVEDSAATTSSSTASTSKRRRLAQDRTASPAAGSSLAPPRQVSPNGGGSVSRATLEPDNQPPVSPVVIGFQFSEGDPASRDAVRSALKMREQQQALINQRRGLAAATNKNPSASPQGSPAALAVAGPSSHHQHANGRSPHPANAHTLPSINSILTPKSASPIIIASPASGAPPAELTSADPLSRHPNELPQLEQEPPTPPLGSAGIGGFAEGGLARRRTDGGRSKAATLSIRTSGGAGSSDGAKSAPMQSTSTMDSPMNGGPGQATPLVVPHTAYPSGVSQQQQPFYVHPTHTMQYPDRRSAPIPPSRTATGGPTSVSAREHAATYPPTGGGSVLPHPPPPVPLLHSPSFPPHSATYPPRIPSAYPPPPPHQHRPPSPGSPHDLKQKALFLSPFERFYDALVDSRTLQATLGDLAVRGNELQRRADDQITRGEEHHRRSVAVLHTLQASSSSLQDMVRKEVNVVRQESMREMDVLWRRVRQLEDGFTNAGLEIPPAPGSASSVGVANGHFKQQQDDARLEGDAISSSPADEDQTMADNETEADDGPDGGEQSSGEGGAKRASLGRRTGVRSGRGSGRRMASKPVKTA